MKILHIIKRPHDRFAYEMAAVQAKDSGNVVSVLLMHDAVYTPPDNHSRLFSCKDDVEARGIECPGVSVSYEDIVTMLLENDSIVSWPSL